MTNTTQIGIELVPLLRSTYGDKNVIATDLRPAAVETSALDVTDFDSLKNLVDSNNVTTIIHLASLLSAVGERTPQLALKVRSPIE